MRLAKARGIETPAKVDLAKRDRNRNKKASNKDGMNPHDPDAKMTEIEDGRTHLARHTWGRPLLRPDSLVALQGHPRDARETDPGVYRQACQALSATGRDGEPGRIGGGNCASGSVLRSVAAAHPTRGIERKRHRFLS